ncbi:hypothetical protein BJY04DRAFT_217428 [Aspergillus karnatakaensis]|uniref:uncharacterized protein n=1 Tax=Aspergillus karnatakaensis TaxID=1810916 RepID=UPI003CCE3474
MSWNKLPREIHLLIFSELVDLHRNSGKVASTHTKAESPGELPEELSEEASEELSEIWSEEASSEYEYSDCEVAPRNIKEVANYLRVSKSWNRDFRKALPNNETPCCFLLRDVDDLAYESMQDFYLDHVTQGDMQWYDLRCGDWRDAMPENWLDETFVFVTMRSQALCMEYLISQRANVNIIHGSEERSLLSYAVETGNVNVVKLLLAAHAD